ncbi:MAG: alpha/beta fold hydrolase [Ktedonobacteraceae bacterium]
MTQFLTQNGSVEINGASLYYEVAGAGDPLVLVHAGVADSRMWDAQFEVFAQQYRVVRYDWRGYGKSIVPVVPFALHEELAELLKHLGIERTHIVGISYGGQITLDFALAHPTMVEKLVLTVPGISGARPSPEQMKYNEAEEAALEAGDLDDATEITLRTWVDGPDRTSDQVDPTVREQVRLMQRQAYDIPFPEGAEGLELEPPAIGRLKEIKAPALIIVGDYDLQPKVEQARWLAGEIAGAQLVIFEEVAHMVNMEKPAEFNQIVLDFLNQ